MMKAFVKAASSTIIRDMDATDNVDDQSRSIRTHLDAARPDFC